MTNLPALPLMASLLAPSAWARGGETGRQIQDAVRGPASPAANADDIPELRKLLAKTGWMPTPEMSGVFQPGFVFQATPLGHRLQIEDCFSVQPTISTYTATEIVSQLQAGVSVNVGAGSVAASGGIVKKVKFGAPEQAALPELKMVPSPECQGLLVQAARRGTDLSTFYVVQDVLTAQIAEQTCGHVDASGRFMALGSADIELSQACAQESLEPVAIGYRTMPVTDLPGMADALDAAGVHAAAPADAAPAAPVHAAPVYAAPVYAAPAEAETGSAAASEGESAQPEGRSHRGGRGHDLDGDGIDDSMDACPASPEDIDGFQDEDGCPDLDNDQDGMLDMDDQCPEQAETLNGVQDQDGCPD